MYVPPERMVSSFSYSALAAACFCSSVKANGLEEELCAAVGRLLTCVSSVRLFAEKRRLLVVSWADGPGEGEREFDERLRGPEGPGIYEPPGGGVGIRTADWSILM